MTVTRASQKENVKPTPLPHVRHWLIEDKTDDFSVGGKGLKNFFTLTNFGVQIFLPAGSFCEGVWIVEVKYDDDTV